MFGYHKKSFSVSWRNILNVSIRRAARLYLVAVQAVLVLRFKVPEFFSSRAEVAAGDVP
jgi:hypothetical protein